MSQLIKIVYTPENGSRRDWTIDLQNPAWDVTFATEKATGWPWAQFVDRIENQSAIALQALLWVLRKRDEPKLQLDSVRPNMDELDFEGQCGRCKEWVDDDSHLCAPAEPERDDDVATPQEGGAPGEA
ncbi:hypothetical protein [Pimelobacter simplex]|uniref:hypothetical protein n=1 Tax=Nocardioides simplex TaxID=2045 RepID=UPI003AAB7FD0